MEYPEKQPKAHIENVRDRFMDFIGNPLNGVLGNLDLLLHEELSPEDRERIMGNLRSAWGNLFRRLEIFKQSDFDENGNITKGEIDRMLAFKDKDSLQPGVVEELNGVYYSIIGAPKR